MSGSAPTRHALCHLRRICLLPEKRIVSRTRTSRALTETRRTSPETASSPGTEPRFRALTRAFSTTARTSQAAAQRRPESSTPPTNTNATADSDSDTKASTAKNTAPLPDITNYYTLFPRTLPTGPPPTGPFRIPLGPLKREFLQLQGQHHPDKYSSSPTSHQKSILALSSLLNTAYKTLSDPLLRARYLLHHNYGVDITSEDNDTHRGLTDQTTLMEVMEVQEAIEEAGTQKQIDTLKDENHARIHQTEKLLAEAFQTEDLKTAKTECIRLNYWRSLQQGLHDWEPGKEVRLIH